MDSLPKVLRYLGSECPLPFLSYGVVDITITGIRAALLLLYYGMVKNYDVLNLLSGRNFSNLHKHFVIYSPTSIKYSVILFFSQKQLPSLEITIFSIGTIYLLLIKSCILQDNHVTFQSPPFQGIAISSDSTLFRISSCLQIRRRGYKGGN